MNTATKKFYDADASRLPSGSAAKWKYNAKTNYVHEQRTTTDPVLFIINKNKPLRSIPVSGAVNWIDGQEVTGEFKEQYQYEKSTGIWVDCTKEAYEHEFFEWRHRIVAIPLAAASLQPKEGENVGKLSTELCQKFLPNAFELSTFKNKEVMRLQAAFEQGATCMYHELKNRVEDTAAGEDIEGLKQIIYGNGRVSWSTAEKITVDLLEAAAKDIIDGSK